MALVSSDGYVAAMAVNGTLLAERGVYTSWECDKERPGYYLALVDITVTDPAGAGEAAAPCSGPAECARSSACTEGCCHLPLLCPSSLIQPAPALPRIPAAPPPAVVDERTVCELGTSTDTENRWWACGARCASGGLVA